MITAYARTNCLGVNFDVHTSGFDLTALQSFDYSNRIDVWDRRVDLERNCVLRDLFGTKYDLLARKVEESGVRQDAKVKASAHAGVKEIIAGKKEFRITGSKWWSR
jgi:hypothetical protein